MCVRTSREPVPDAQHPTRTRSWPLPRALAAPASCPERFLPARGPTERWVGAVGRISRHAQIRAALRPERGGSVGPCQHPLRKPLKTARKELPTPASWGKEGRSVWVFQPKRTESLVAMWVSTRTAFNIPKLFHYSDCSTGCAPFITPLELSPTRRLPGGIQPSPLTDSMRFRGSKLCSLLLSTQV